MGVGEDFAKFKDNYQITHEMVGSISYRYKRITRQLNADFRSNTSDTASPTFSTRVPKRQFSGILRRKGEWDQRVGLRNRV